MFSPLEQFDAIRIVFRVIDLSFFGVPLFEISLFNILIPFILTILILLFYFKWCKNPYYFYPSKLNYVFESLMVFIFDLIKQQIGHEGYLFFPFIFTLFNFILFSNLLSLLPFGIALTSHLIMIMYLSLSVCLSIFILGLFINNLQFLKIFIPECPFILLPMLIFIEIFSYIIRAFSLAIRLSANIMAGHTLVFLITSFLLNIAKIKIIFFVFLFVFLAAILLLELGVAFLQAYVFTVLVCIYLNDAIKGGH